MRPKIDVNIHDSHIGIWQDDSRDASFRSEIYAPLIRAMRGRGWSIHRDPDVHRRYRTLSPNRRLGSRGTLRCKIDISGRVVEVEFWSTTAPQINRHGRRYDFDKMTRMSHIDSLRVRLEFGRIISWLGTLAPVKVKHGDTVQLSPMEVIEKEYAESCHTKNGIGRPDWGQDYNRKSRDGLLLEHGQAVWMVDRKGRILRGQAFYRLNSMWWVIAGGELHNVSCGEICARRPDDLRAKQNERLRRGRLESELEASVRRMDFKRSQILKDLLFGSQPTFMIWARDRSAYYRSNYSGYTTDSISAGRYTREEAERECRLVPHGLEMVGPNGSVTRFDKVAG